MALITCTQCGHQISSQARFCPKCTYSKSSAVQDSPRPTGDIYSGNEIPRIAVPPNSTHSTASNAELLQLEFKPSIDELIILEGRTFLIKSILNVSDCYAYLTSKRYILCDASGVNIIFQIGNNGFASVAEGRHLISRKIIIKTVSGETYQVKTQLHHPWFNALLNPQGAADASEKPSSEPVTVSAGATEWYYKEDGIKIGPIKEKNMIQLIQNNHTVYRDTNVWNTYLTEWKLAEETILSFYFRESTASGVVSGGAHRASKISSQSFYSRIGLLFKRYT